MRGFQLRTIQHRFLSGADNRGRRRMKETLAFCKASFLIGVLTLALLLSPLASEHQKCAAMDIKPADTLGTLQLTAFNNSTLPGASRPAHCSCTSSQSLCCSAENKRKTRDSHLFLSPSDPPRHLLCLAAGIGGRAEDRTPVPEIAFFDSLSSFHQAKDPFLLNCSFLI